MVDTDLVAFVDSDCTVTDGWLDRPGLAVRRPDLAAVAPGCGPITTGGRPARRRAGRFADAHSALDMGTGAGRGGPGQAVRYVPTAALVARRAALAVGFDPGLRVGEDVDLVWRLVEGGWRVRYEPSVTVFHQEPTTWRGRSPGASATARRPVRCRSGTRAGWPRSSSAPWPTAAAVALLAGRRASPPWSCRRSAVLLARRVR